ncbi:TRAP transporter substrate-binding protein [Limibaculum sp. M0105]|uniref:TRAP transporter substrate-binding protein n=1 Tax=Thermohalobaculum xanthum TaxID=2753746 RepID=A0A8J7MBE2_9RHOB|nr:TRAP transporter substrate-binding protein [Thermohalobaculum xanthum]MBK0401280.1 TRAP transporter substrate-binding protein [Thermohalobaculum xanthum]
MKAYARLSAVVIGALVALPAAAQEVTLTVQHFLGPKAPAQTKLIEPWAKRVEEASQGRIKVEIFPAMALGGKPPELYRQVRDGVVDIVWTLPGYTPGVFPRVEVFELPGIHQGSAAQTTLAIQDMMPALAPDFADVHPLLIHSHAGNALHMVDGPIASADDLAGKKLRTPSRTGAWMIEAWGAEPVGMPVPELPQALAKKVVDGALVPFEIVPPLKLQELTAASVEGPEGLRFGTAVFLLAMNKARYESLPEDLRAIIDANSGANLAAEIGKVWDDVEAPGKALQADSPGGQVVELDGAVYEELIARASSVTDRWVEEITATGIDGQALVDEARKSMAAHGN